jgi:hypothetical protein
MTMTISRYQVMINADDCPRHSAALWDRKLREAYQGAALRQHAEPGNDRNTRGRYQWR